MSRARASTTACVVADDVAQAVEDLTRDWSVARTPTWALDTGLPDPNHPDPHVVERLGQQERIRLVAVAHAQTRVTLQATTGIRMPARPVELDAAVAALHQAKADHGDLNTGRGRYRDKTKATLAMRDTPVFRVKGSLSMCTYNTLRVRVDRETIVRVGRLSIVPVVVTEDRGRLATRFVGREVII
jgi:hypothetical protein